MPSPFEPPNPRSVEQWLAGFALDEWLGGHVAHVVASLPEAVRSDLITDPTFMLCDYEPRHGQAVEIPARLGMAGKPGRSVLLKRTLRRRPVNFVRYVIAHELAHAHLRNRGRWQGDDPELAADALAASWGFPRAVW